MKARATAPGKVILTGEHFVVHGAWALAAAIERRSTAVASESDRLQVVSGIERTEGRRALVPAARVVEAMARELSFRPEVKVRISSDIPGGAGLGSSASTSVAVAAAVARLKSVRLTPAELARFAMEGEREVHGNPSGVDAAVCARGGVMLFRPGSRPRMLKLRGPRRLLVAFSGARRNTGRLVSHVADVKDRLPSLFRGLAESAGELSQLAAERLASGDMEALGPVLTLNHAALAEVGVSTPELDSLVDLLISLGCHGAKLTGAGGGGSVVGVSPRGKEKRITSELTGRGFEAFVCMLPAEGVKSWLEP